MTSDLPLSGVLCGFVRRNATVVVGLESLGDSKGVSVDLDRLGRQRFRGWRIHHRTVGDRVLAAVAVTVDRVCHSRPPDSSAWVQTALNALNSPAFGWVITACASGKILPLPTGMSGLRMTVQLVRRHRSSHRRRRQMARSPGWSNSWCSR